MNTTRILITGASGFLGRKLFDAYSTRGEVVGTYFNHPSEGLIPLQVTDDGAVKKLFSEFRPTVVIHTVALSEPDFCEDHPEETEQVNHEGTKNILAACREVGARLNFIGTSYDFDGKKSGLYVETDPTNPINVYGRTKLNGEEEVKTLPDYAIYRFDKMYGYNGPGRDNDLLGKILAGRELDVNSQQTGLPLWVGDVAAAISFLDECGEKGIFHLAGPEEMKREAFTRRLAALVDREDLVRSVEPAEQRVRRPVNTRLSTEKVRALGVKFTPFEESLEIISRELHRLEPERFRPEVER